MTPILTEAGRVAIAKLITGGASDDTLDACKVGLYTNNPALDPTTVLADLTPATFTGYALSTVVAWDTPLLDPASGVSVHGAEKEFVATDGATPEVIFGYYLVVPAVTGPPAVAAHILMVCAFDDPISVAAAGHGVRVRPELSYP